MEPGPFFFKKRISLAVFSIQIHQKVSSRRVRVYGHNVFFQKNILHTKLQTITFRELCSSRLGVRTTNHWWSADGAGALEASVLRTSVLRLVPVEWVAQVSQYMVVGVSLGGEHGGRSWRPSSEHSYKPS